MQGGIEPRYYVVPGAGVSTVFVKGMNKVFDNPYIYIYMDYTSKPYIVWQRFFILGKQNHGAVNKHILNVFITYMYISQILLPIADTYIDFCKVRHCICILLFLMYVSRVVF
jgi:hypothetical protein